MNICIKAHVPINMHMMLVAFIAAVLTPFITTSQPLNTHSAEPLAQRVSSRGGSIARMITVPKSIRSHVTIDETSPNWECNTESSFAFTDDDNIYAAKFGFLPTATPEANLAALNAAITAAAAIPDDGDPVVVHIPAGNYSVSGEIIMKSNVTLRGKANETTIKLADASYSYLLGNDDPTNGNTKIRVENIKFDGNQANNVNRIDAFPAWNGNAIQFVNCTNVVVNNCTFTQCYKYCVLMAGCNNWKVVGSNFVNTPKDGVHVQGPSSGGQIVNCTMSDTGDDPFALTCNDYPYAIVTKGDISDVAIRNIQLTGTASGGLVLAGSDPTDGNYTVSNIRLSNISGTTKGTGIRIHSDEASEETSNGNWEDITLTNISLDVASEAAVSIQITTTGTVKKLACNGVRQANIVTDGSQGNGIAVSGLGIIDDLTITKSVGPNGPSQPYLVVDNASTVNTLKLSNCDFQLGTDLNPGIPALNLQGMTPSLTISNCTFERLNEGKNGGYGIVLGSNNAGANVKLSGISFKNLIYGLWLSNLPAGSTNVSLNQITFQNVYVGIRIEGGMDNVTRFKAGTITRIGDWPADENMVWCDSAQNFSVSGKSLPVSGLVLTPLVGDTFTNYAPGFQNGPGTYKFNGKKFVKVL